MSEHEYPTCRWHQPDTLAHDLEVLSEALREVGRQFIIAVTRDVRAIARAYRRAVEEVDT